MVHTATALTGLFADRLAAAFSKKAVAAARESKMACGESFASRIDPYWYVLNYSLAYLALLEASLLSIAPTLWQDLENARNARFRTYKEPLLEELAIEYRYALYNEGADDLSAVAELVADKCNVYGVDPAEVARVLREELQAAMERTSDDVILALTQQSQTYGTRTVHTGARPPRAGIPSQTRRSTKRLRLDRKEAPPKVSGGTPANGIVTEERVVATLKTSETTELIFYLDRWRDRTWANVRKFLHSDSYVGSTKAGLKLDVSAIPSIVNALSTICERVEDIEQREYLRLPAAGKQFVALNGSLYKGMLGVDLRVWLSGSGRPLPTKKGVRIPAELLREALGCFDRLASVGASCRDGLLPGAPSTEFVSPADHSPTEGIPPRLAGLFEEEGT